MFGNEPRNGIPVAMGKKYISGGVRELAIHFIGWPTQVRGQNNITKGAQGMVYRQWLLLEDIEAGAGNVSIPERLIECRLVDDRATRGINQVCGRLQKRETPFINQAS